MAHIRDHRRRTYYEVIEATSKQLPNGAKEDPRPERRDLADEIDVASAESTRDLDQVLYHPRRLVCSFPEDRSSDEWDLLQTEVAKRLRAADKIGFELRGVKLPNPNDSGRLLVYAWTDPPRSAASAPNGEVGAGDGTDGPDDQRNDSFQFAVELDQRFTDMVAPMYVTVSQQGVQPGEDPEAGVEVVGIHPPLSRAPADRPLGDGIHIAVIDTGIDPKAADPAGPLKNQHFDQRDRDPLLGRTRAGDPSDKLGPAGGHGTFIASLIHAVAPGAHVHSIRVASTLGTASEEAIAEGIRRALQDTKVNMISLSIGGYPFVSNSAWPTLPAFKVLEKAISEVPPEIAIVAAAGNCGSKDKFYPAAFPRVIGVSALDDCCANRLWGHSNYGAWVKACTRGVNLRGLFVKGVEDPQYDPDGKSERWDSDQRNWATWTGTSFAAPLVAAQIAILASEMGWHDDTERAAQALLRMAKPHPDQRPCGRHILVDLPGQT